MGRDDCVVEERDVDDLVLTASHFEQALAEISSESAGEFDPALLADGCDGSLEDAEAE